METTGIPVLLTPAEVSKALGCNEQTLAKWRMEKRASRRRVPLAFTKIGGKVMYSATAVTAFIASRTYTPGEKKQPPRNRKLQRKLLPETTGQAEPRRKRGPA